MTALICGDCRIPVDADGQPVTVPCDEHRPMLVRRVSEPHEDCTRSDCSDRAIERLCGHSALDGAGVPRVVGGDPDAVISGLAERIQWLVENGPQPGWSSGGSTR